MAEITEQMVLKALGRILDPDLQKDIVSLGFVKDIKICDGNVAFTIELTTPACPVKEKMKEEAYRYVKELPGVETINVQMTAQVRPSRGEMKQQLIPTVKNVIPVASGKGGVGKSTVSANIALAFAKMGARVGLMDSDVYGPSIPTIMGVNKPPPMKNNKLLPIEQYGVKIISVGFFIKQEEAVVWRGPMLHKIVSQFLGEVEWGDLDYLIVDLPPGTGDVQLSLCQLIPLTGAAIVSTPQDVALLVAQKAITMFKKLNCPVLGLIENMSYFLCRHCGKREEIFGSGGVRKACERLSVPFLGEIPLSTDIRLTSDNGVPIVFADPEGEMSQAFIRVAENLAAQVSIKNMQSGMDEPIKISY